MSIGRVALTKTFAIILMAVVRLLGVVGLVSVEVALAQEAVVQFEIQRFQVDGNSLLTPARIDKLVAPYVGKGKNYGDVQKALEALDGEYRRLGYGTVNVYVPEQELTSGVVRLQITEAVVGKVVITGNSAFNEKNIRNSLPQVKEGTPPNMRFMSENIQLANENPAKQVEVTLATAEEDNKVDVKVAVTEEKPSRFFVTVDNTGTRQSGKQRLGFAYQNANLFNLDHVLTMGYTTAFDALNGGTDSPARQGVDVAVYSVGYRIPLYSLGDSIDFVYGNSSTNTPASIIAPGGTLAINGKGEVIGLRYNHIFSRSGNYSSKLVGAYDYKYINARCTTAGQPTPINPDSPLITSSCTPYTLRPLTATYSGSYQPPGQSIDFNIGVSHHLFPMGLAYAPGTTAPLASEPDRYSFVGGRQIKDRFTVWRLGGSYAAAIYGEWLGRAAINAQMTGNELPAGEQLSLTGATTVRGFNERAVARDTGYVGNLEIYSPDFAAPIGIQGNLKLLGFYDWATGTNVNVIPSLTAATNTTAHVASIGMGLRYNIKKDLSFKFDIARVLDGYRIMPSSNANSTGYLAEEGNIRGHFSFAYGF